MSSVITHNGITLTGYAVDMYNDDHPINMRKHTAPNVILITGKARSGKDYTANLLKQALEANGKIVQQLFFAAPLKQIIAATFDITLEQLDEYKNYQVPLFIDKHMDAPSVTNFRTILQRFGTEGMKPIFGEEVWAQLVNDQITQSSADCVIISDYRFDIEYTTLAHHNPTVIQVLGVPSANIHQHSSEQTPTAAPFDHIVDNSNQDSTVINWVANFTRNLS